jgi:uncharacterized protein
MRLVFVTSVQLLLGCLPAAALDCTKAQSADENTICQTPDLLAQDDQLNAAFKKLLAAATTDEKDNLRKSQRLWLRNDRNCEGDYTCLDRAIGGRLRQFKAVAETGPGTGATMSFATFADDAADWSRVEGPRFNVADAPFKAAWNKVFDAAVELRKQNPTPAVDEDEGDSPDSSNFQIDDFSVSLATPQFLSGSHYSSTYFAGAAHPEWNEVAINLLVPSGEKLTFKDVIKPEKIDALVKACASKSETEGGVQDAEMPALKSAVTDMDYWHFRATEISIKFPPFSVSASYLQSISQCNFSASELKPFMNSRFKIWPLP